MRHPVSFTRSASYLNVLWSLLPGLYFQIPKQYSRIGERDFCPLFTKKLSPVLSVGHVWKCASWIAGPWTGCMGTGCVTRLMTCYHWEMLLRMQTFDMWIWYRLMVSDEREITLRLNFSHLFLGEEKPKKSIVSLAPSQQKKPSDKDERNNKCQVLFYFHFIRQK